MSKNTEFLKVDRFLACGLIKKLNKMRSKKNQYIKYTKSELENYVKNEESCVKKIKSVQKLAIQPFMLHDLQSSVLQILSKKIGKFDAKLKGIVLDYRNTKVLTDKSLAHNDCPEFYVQIETNFYVFIPYKGAIVNGQIKHISVTAIESNVVVIIYRVFNVNVIFKGKIPKELKINKEIQVKVKDFHFDNEIPYIEGELVHQSQHKLTAADPDSVDSGIDENNLTSYKRASTSSKKLDKKSKISEKAVDDSSSDSDDEVPKVLAIKKEKLDIQIKQEKLSEKESSSESDQEPENSFMNSLETLPKIKKEKASDSSDDEPPTPLNPTMKKRKLDQSSDSSFKSPKKRKIDTEIKPTNESKGASSKSNNNNDTLSEILGFLSSSSSQKSKKTKKKINFSEGSETDASQSSKSKMNLTAIKKEPAASSDVESTTSSKKKIKVKKEKDVTDPIMEIFNQSSSKKSPKKDKKDSNKSVVDDILKMCGPTSITTSTPNPQKKSKKDKKKKTDDLSSSIMNLFTESVIKKEAESSASELSQSTTDKANKKKKKKDKSADLLQSIDQIFNKAKK